MSKDGIEVFIGSLKSTRPVAPTINEINNVIAEGWAQKAWPNPVEAAEMGDTKDER